MAEKPSKARINQSSSPTSWEKWVVAGGTSKVELVVIDQEAEALGSFVRRTGSGRLPPGKTGYPRAADAPLPQTNRNCPSGRVNSSPSLIA